MADFHPPDDDATSGKARGKRSGTVADFRYKRSPRPNRKHPSREAKAEQAAGVRAGHEDSRRAGLKGAGPSGGAPPAQARRVAPDTPRQDHRPSSPSHAAPPAQRKGQAGAARSEPRPRRDGARPARNETKAPPRTPAGNAPDRSARKPGGKYQGRRKDIPRPQPGADAARPGGLRRPHAYAALDLGTNNCRLLIARPDGDSFTVIDAFSRVVRLGEGLTRTGRLSEPAIERTLAALQICADKLRKRRVDLSYAVATEACRRARNGAEFIAEVHHQTGIRLNIISPGEEARLAVLGCHLLLEQGEGPAIIFDIGGGSTELVLLEEDGGEPRMTDWLSVPWGVVSLSDVVGSDESSAEARALRYRAMRERVRESFAPFERRLGARRERSDLRLLGTSGTVTTLGGLWLGLEHYDRKAVDGLVLPSAEMAGICSQLASRSPDERAAIPCIGEERARLVIAGCAILEEIIALWPAARLSIADRGIREGILRQLMADEIALPAQYQRLYRGSPLP